MMGGGPSPGRPAGEEFLLQALIAAEHAIAPTPEATRWDRIAAHYAELEGLTGSPVVRLNRAVAVAEDQGPQAGLAVLEGLEEQLLQSHRLAAVRGELLLRAGRPADAVDAFAEAISLCANSAERALLEARRADAAGAREADCTSGGSRAAVPASGEGG
jgi:RNA polymerase sigma-70 factor (ECF subfamily)